MSSSVLNKAYDTLINLWDKLTRINGLITLEAVNKPEDELGGIFTLAKTHHYTQGQKYGHLASAIPKSKYRLIIGNATWTHMVPTDPEAYPADALNASNVAAMHKQFLAQHKIQRGGEGTHPLRCWQQRSRPPQEAIYQFWQHNSTSNDQSPTPENSNQDDNYTKIRVQDEWVQHSLGSTTVYFMLLNCFQVLLGDCGIAMSNKEEMMAAEAQMWQSKMFTEDQMVIWDNRGAMAQTWVALQTYFTEKWLEQKQYLATTAKQLQFKEAVLLAHEIAAAKEEGETQAMLFAMLQDQHTKQIAQMEATNKTKMDAMMEQMKALVAAGGAQ
jgi:hypothetical protein